MKNTIIISIISLICLSVSSCVYETIRPDNEVTTRTVSFTDYSGLRVSDAFDVYVTFSDVEERISIEANSNIQDYIEVKKEGSMLNIGLEKHTRIRGDVTLKAYISAGLITDFDLSGASQLYLNNELRSDYVSIDLSGASGFSGEVITDHLTLEGSGASTFDLSGSVGHVNAKVSGASTLRDFNLIADELELRLSGASNSYMTVIESIHYRGSGASTLFYKGNPHIGSSDVSGASRIVHRK